jgi:hypothetical protein
MSEETAAPAPEPAPLLAATERVLTDAFGGPVRLEVRDTLRERYRNRVLRLAVTDGPAGTPATVIVKTAEGEGDDAYDPAKDALGGTSWRLYNEWAGNSFLGSLGAEPPLSARLIGGDRETGVIVLEDLGAPLSLADRLTGDDPAAAEAALLAYARSMGRLHAATAGREEEFMSLRRTLGATETAREREGVRWLRENVAPFQELLGALGIAPAPGFEADVEEVRRAMDEPGPWLAFAPGDTCPDNHKLTDDGAAVRFFDFEFAGFRHALLDAAYFHLPFPTCWCVNRLPDGRPARLEAAYRAEAARGIPAVADDAAFDRERLRAGAYWLPATLSWGWQDWLKEDRQWGISTRRQRHLLRLENVVALAERAGPDRLPALTDAARRLRDVLAARWLPEGLEPMPLYPPFRAGAGEE